MLRLFTALKDAWAAAEERRRPEQYHAWVGELNARVLAPLLPVFCALQDRGSGSGEARKALLRQVCDVLDGAGVGALLGRSLWVPRGDAAENDAPDVVAAKQVLLELWFHLLECIAPVPTPHVSPTILRTVAALMRRPEFSMAAFLSIRNGTTCPAHQLSLAQRYRTLLGSTFRYVADVLSASAIPKDECLSPISPFFFRINGLLYPCSGLASPASPGTSTDPSAAAGAAGSCLPGTESFTLDGSRSGSGSGSGDSGNGDDDDEDDDEDDDTTPSFESVAVPDEAHPNKLGLSLMEETRDSLRGTVAVADAAEAALQAARPTYSQLTPQFQEFAAQVLAVVYWRIPLLQSDILAAATKKAELGPTVVLPEAAPFIDATDCPLLLQWGRWHRTLRRLMALHSVAVSGGAATTSGAATSGGDSNSSAKTTKSTVATTAAPTVAVEDSEAERLKAVPKRWLWHLSRHHAEFFVVFFLEWLRFARRALGEETERDVAQQRIDWRRIPGYTDLTRAFLSVFARISFQQFPAREMEQAELALLTTMPAVIMNAYVRLLYRRTHLAEIPSLVNAVLTVESWLAELHAKHLTLGDAFDMAHFCAGLDGILQTDQHLIVSRLLATLYNYTSVFAGKNRLVLFGHLLLEQHFYHLFCHWDDNVRLIYNQVLLFAMLRTPQAQLFPSEARAVPNQRKSFYSHDAWSAESIDTLLYVKIEAYVKTVAAAASSATASSADASNSTPATAPRQREPLSAAAIATIPAAATTPSTAAGGSGGSSAKRSLNHVLDALSSLARPVSASASPSPSPSPRLPQTPRRRVHKQYVVEDAVVPVLQGPSAASGDGKDDDVLVPPPTPVTLAGEMPARLRIYARRAYADYRRHLARYNEWQSRQLPNPPKLITMV